VSEKLLTLKEAAECLHLEEKDVRRLVNEGKISAYHICGMYLRFKEENIFSVRGKYGGKLTHKHKEGKNQSQVSLNPAISGIRDFFYFNDFYIIAGILVVFLIYIILKSIH
jgi:excisionase family DNA binding protein